MPLQYPPNPANRPPVLFPKICLKFFFALGLYLADISSPCCNYDHQTDEFLLNLGTKAIGDVKRIDIGFASKQSTGGGLGSIFGMDWFLHSCELVHTNTQRRAFFAYSGWLKKDNKRVVLEESQPSKDVQYKVVVKTSDLR